MDMYEFIPKFFGTVCLAEHVTVLALEREFFPKYFGRQSFLFPLLALPVFPLSVESDLTRIFLALFSGTRRIKLYQHIKVEFQTK